MIEEDLVSFLKASIVLADSRVRPLSLAQNPLFPALTYRKISAPRELSHSGSSGLAHPRFQIDCWGGKSYPDAKRLSEEVIDELHGFKGVMGATRVDLVEVVNELDDYDESTNRHRIIVDVIIWHQE